MGARSSQPPRPSASAASGPRRPSPSPPRPPRGRRRPHGLPVPPRRHEPADAAEHRRGRRAGPSATARPATAPTPASRSCARRWPTTSPLARRSRYAPENVAIQPGGKPVIGKFILALMNPGDEVLYPNPGYPIYESQIEFHGGVGRALRLRRRARATSSSTWTRIERQITPRTRLLIFNNLQNPTGAESPRRELERLAELVAAGTTSRALRRGLLRHPLRGAEPVARLAARHGGALPSSSTPSARSSP